MTVLDEIGRSRYVSLTTYRRNGTPVATPVWHVRDGAELFVVTEVATGKVKRIRNNSRVVVTVCEGRPSSVTEPANEANPFIWTAVSAPAETTGSRLMLALLEAWYLISPRSAGTPP